MLFIFVVIIAAPIVLRNTKQLDKFLQENLWKELGVPSPDKLGLLQPLDHNLNDTVDWYTGSKIPNGKYSSSIPTPAQGSDKWSNN